MSKIAKIKAKVKGGKPRWPGKETKPGGNLNDFEKEQKAKFENRSLKGKNIPEYGEYRCYYTRTTLEKEMENLNHKEKMLVLALELFRNKKTNTFYFKKRADVLIELKKKTC